MSGRRKPVVRNAAYYLTGDGSSEKMTISEYRRLSKGSILTPIVSSRFDSREEKDTYKNWQKRHRISRPTTARREDVDQDEYEEMRKKFESDATAHLIARSSITYDA